MGERESFLDDPDGRSTLQPLALDSIYAIWFLQAFASWQDWATVCLYHHPYLSPGVEFLAWTDVRYHVLSGSLTEACMFTGFIQRPFGQSPHLPYQGMAQTWRAKKASNLWTLWSLNLLLLQSTEAQFVLACSLARSSFLHRLWECALCSKLKSVFFWKMKSGSE